MAVSRDPGVDGSKNLGQARNAIDPRDPFPRLESPGDFIQRIRSDIQAIIRLDQTHPGIEIGISEGGEAIFKTGRLSGCILEQLVPILAPDSINLAATERAIAVEYDHGFSAGFNHEKELRIIERRNGEG